MVEHGLIVLLGLEHLIDHPAQGKDQGDSRQDGGHPKHAPPGRLGRLPSGQILVHDLLHHGQLGIGELRGRALLSRFSVLLPQQPAHGYGEHPAQGDELFHLGQYGVRLPFIDGLAGHSQLLSQGLLRQAQFLSLLGYALTYCHGRHLLCLHHIGKSRNHATNLGAESC